MLPVNSLVSQKCTDFKNNISTAVIPSSNMKVMFLKIPVGVKLQVEKISLKKNEARGHSQERIYTFHTFHFSLTKYLCMYCVCIKATH